MKDAPHILAVAPQADACVLRLAIPVDLACFAGHFPGRPLLPGVVQIGWALDLAARHLGTPSSCREVEALKFQRVMPPGQRITLTLRLDRARGKLHFSYHDGDVAFSTGRLALEPLP